MNNELKKIIKKIDGNVLGIGLDEKLSEIIDQNDRITECNLLNSYVKGKFKGSLFQKTIKIKKIRKIFKKKKVDYIICDYDQIKKYLNTFVKDSVYINKNKLYFFGNVDFDLINYKYQRYDTKIDVKKYKDKYIVEIDNSKAKNNFLKDNYYRVKDFKDKIIEVIGDVLMN